MTKEERKKKYIETMPYPLGKQHIQQLERIGFFIAPASRKFHSNYEGGLFDHSCATTHSLVELTQKNNLEWARPESPYIVGMYHDLCKCDEYELENEEYVSSKDQLFRGHGEKSVLLASTLTTLTMEELACITYHMGAFTRESEWGNYTNAIHYYPNVLWTHHADMIAAHIIEKP